MSDDGSGQEHEREGRRPATNEPQLAPGLWVAIGATVALILVLLVFVLLQYFM